MATNRAVSTYVFLEFETTGLLHEQRQDCRITEICMIAVNRKDMVCAKDVKDSTLPRVLDKVKLCIDPQKPISYVAKRMTGLSNALLNNKQQFSAETVKFINSFLRMQKRPVCLLAHNGNRFDFPLLIAELERVEHSLDGDILCADTLKMFKSLDSSTAKDELNSKTTENTSSSRNEKSDKANAFTTNEQTTPLTQSSVKRKLNDTVSPPTKKKASFTNTCTTSTGTKPSLSKSKSFPSSGTNSSLSRTTLDYQGRTATAATYGSQIVKKALKATSASTTFDSQTDKKSSLTKSISYPQSTTRTASASSTVGSPIRKKLSYNLGQIYLRMFGSPPPDSHSAEGDCIAMLRIVQHTPGCFGWIDKNAVRLYSICKPY